MGAPNNWGEKSHHGSVSWALIYTEFTNTSASKLNNFLIFPVSVQWLMLSARWLGEASEFYHQTVGIVCE